MESCSSSSAWKRLSARRRRACSAPNRRRSGLPSRATGSCSTTPRRKPPRRRYTPISALRSGEGGVAWIFHPPRRVVDLRDRLPLYFRHREAVLPRGGLVFPGNFSRLVALDRGLALSGRIPGPMDSIIIRGAREHNLKNVNIEIPRNRLVVITGVSGSGKSSLAFDTLFAEGQRRYVESLSSYARQFLQQMEKPDVDSIEGLSPAISIEQRTTSKNPRSTVGTVTEIYDYLRLLYAS